MQYRIKLLNYNTFFNFVMLCNEFELLYKNKQKPERKVHCDYSSSNQQSHNLPNHRMTVIEIDTPMINMGLYKIDD